MKKGGFFLVFLFASLCPAAGGAIEVPPPPAAEADAWLLVEHASGQVLAGHNADKKRPPASLTKLMTAYLLFGRLQAGEISLADPVRISEKAWGMPGARLFLRPGSQVALEDLVKGMLVRSANDATLALVEHVAGSEEAFVAQMNAAARALGMTETVFVNATGLPQAGHVSSARDLARLTSVLIRDFPDYYARWFALRDFAFQGIRQYNRNALLWRDGAVDGVKTGQTREAGHCLIASARHGSMRLIVVILGAKDDNARFVPAQRLLEYGFRHFETRLLYAADTPAVRVRVWMGDRRELPLGVGRDLYLTLPRGAHDRLSARLTVREALIAPVRHGQRLGTLVLDLDQKPLAEYPLVALQEISPGNLLRRAWDRIELWLHR